LTGPGSIRALLPLPGAIELPAGFARPHRRHVLAIGSSVRPLRRGRHGPAPAAGQSLPGILEQSNIVGVTGATRR